MSHWPPGLFFKLLKIWWSSFNIAKLEISSDFKQISFCFEHHHNFLYHLPLFPLIQSHHWPCLSIIKELSCCILLFSSRTEHTVPLHVAWSAFCHILDSGCISIIIIDPVKSQWLKVLTELYKLVFLFFKFPSLSHLVLLILSPLVVYKCNCASNYIFSRGLRIIYLGKSLQQAKKREQMVVFLQNST